VKASAMTTQEIGIGVRIGSRSMAVRAPFAECRTLRFKLISKHPGQALGISLLVLTVSSSKIFSPNPPLIKVHRGPYGAHFFGPSGVDFYSSSDGQF